MGQPFVTSINVRFYELDPYGHVNHSVYLQYCEAARVEMLRSVGLGLDTLAQSGTHLVVIGLRARYVRAAYLGDTLRIETGVATTGRVRAQWLQRITRGDDLVLTAVVDFASTDPDGRPRRLPGEIGTALAAHIVEADWLDIVEAD